MFLKKLKAIKAMPKEFYFIVFEYIVFDKVLEIEAHKKNLIKKCNNLYDVKILH